LAFESEQFKII